MDGFKTSPRALFVSMPSSAGCTTSFTDRYMYHAGKAPVLERGCSAGAGLTMFVQLSVGVLSMELPQEWILQSAGYCLAGSAIATYSLLEILCVFLALP